MLLAVTVDDAERESDFEGVINDLSTWSSRRTPGPILRGLSIEALEQRSFSTTLAGGYGSRRSPGRLAETEYRLVKSCRWRPSASGWPSRPAPATPSRGTA